MSNESSAYIIKCVREIDNKEIYICSKIKLSNWTQIIDSLIDSKFTINKIFGMEYLDAFQNNKFCYFIKDDNYESFLYFIEDNYRKVNTLNEKYNLI